MPFSLEAAQEVGGIPLVWLWTASANGFLGYSQYGRLIDEGIVPFKGTYLSYLTLCVLFL